jgi:hypothetical protein
VLVVYGPHLRPHAFLEVGDSLVDQSLYDFSSDLLDSLLRHSYYVLNHSVPDCLDAAPVEIELYGQLLDFILQLSESR